MVLDQEDGSAEEEEEETFSQFLAKSYRLATIVATILHARVKQTSATALCGLRSISELRGGSMWFYD